MPKAHGKAKGRSDKNHSQGFRDALEDALSNASQDPDLGPGNYEVKVDFIAEVEVKNPGVVGLYKVQLSKL